MPGGGGGDVLQPRGVGEILSAAFEIYKNNAAQLILIVALVVVPLQFLSHLLSGVVFAAKKGPSIVIGDRIVTTTLPRNTGVVILAALVAAVITVVITSALQAAITRAAAQTTVGDAVDVGESYRFGFKRFGAVFLLSLLVGLVVAVGFILLIIPGIIFLTLLAVAVPALVIERLGVTAAMSRSWNLAKGNFWHVLGTIIIAAIIAGVVSGILGAIGGSSWFLGWIFGSIGAIITGPFTALVSVLLYLDLRTRSEALTSAQLRSELAAT
jgi:hypothetical protein